MPSREINGHGQVFAGPFGKILTLVTCMLGPGASPDLESCRGYIRLAGLQVKGC
jgi:hypothetical protein